MKLYIDSNVLLSYFLRELGGRTNAQFAWTRDFINLSATRGYVFVMSALAYFEIEKRSHLTQAEVENLLYGFGVNFKSVTTTNRDRSKAEKIKRQTGIHRPDNVHTYLALKHKTDNIVTWNLKDFIKVKKLIVAIEPRDVT